MCDTGGKERYGKIDSIFSEDEIIPWKKDKGWIRAKIESKCSWKM